MFIASKENCLFEQVLRVLIKISNKNESERVSGTFWKRLTFNGSSLYLGMNAFPYMPDGLVSASLPGNISFAVTVHEF